VQIISVLERFEKMASEHLAVSNYDVLALCAQIREELKPRALTAPLDYGSGSITFSDPPCPVGPAPGIDTHLPTLCNLSE
jgi:hypothetical protein